MFTLELHWDRPNRLLQTNGSTEHHLLVRLVPQASARLPLRLAMAIDTSGSMGEGGRLAGAQRAARAMVDRLAAVDRISIASFSTAVSPIVTDADPRAQGDVARRAIDALRPGGYTRADLALRWLSEALRGGTGARVAVIVTDGFPTDAEGRQLKEFGPLLDVAGTVATAGTSLYAVGYGDAQQFATDFLNDMANRGRGSFLFARDEGELGPQIDGLVRAAQTIVAERVDFQVAARMAGARVVAMAQVAPAYVPMDPPTPGADGGISFSVANVAGSAPLDIVIRMEVPCLRFGASPGVREVVSVDANAVGSAAAGRAQSAAASLSWVAQGPDAQREDRAGQQARDIWRMNAAQDAVLHSPNDRMTGVFLDQLQQHALAADRKDVADAAGAQLDVLQRTGRVDKNGAARMSGMVRNSRKPGD